MADRAVVNASPLVVLSRAGRLELLRLVGDRIVIPQAVVEEVKGHSDEAARALEDGSWFEQAPVAVIPESIAAWDLGPGESAVLSWAVAHPGTVAIIDDHAARKCAEVVGVTVKGTLGLALLAKRRGWVPAARPVIEEFRRNGLYLSEDLVARALAFVDE